MKYLIQKIITYEGELDLDDKTEAIQFLKDNLSIIPETTVEVKFIEPGDSDGGSDEEEN